MKEDRNKNIDKNGDNTIIDMKPGEDGKYELDKVRIVKPRRVNKSRHDAMRDIHGKSIDEILNVPKPPPFLVDPSGSFYKFAQGFGAGLMLLERLMEFRKKIK